MTCPEEGDRHPSANPINHNPDAVDSVVTMENEPRTSPLSPEYRRKYALHQGLFESEDIQ